MLKTRKLPLAFANEQLASVVKIEKIDTKTVGFGMLAADPNGLKRGVGKALVGAAEAWALAEGFSEMEIEIVRAENPNGHKQSLHD
ncbi:MAG: GNAT family N-acetyltransferase [Pseudomonadota bacterium]|nr:GNAT family N-acetyltransferase [Pseudomonadota bacterium]